MRTNMVDDDVKKKPLNKVCIRVPNDMYFKMRERALDANMSMCEYLNTIVKSCMIQLDKMENSK